MSNNQLPKISIITITYNAEGHIEKTLKSVMEQEYENIEYIIVDGRSTDDTMRIIGRYSDRIDLVISEPDKGIYDAMNKGLSHVTGKWVNFLNAGDLFYNSQTLKEIFNELPEDIKLVYGDWINVNNKGLYRYIQSNPVLSMKKLGRKFQMNHQSLFVKTDHLPKYDLSYKIKADYQWVIDIVVNLDQSNIQYINKPLVKYDLEGLSEKQLLINMFEYIYLTNRNFGKSQVIKNSPIFLKYLMKFIILKIKKWFN